MTYGEMKRFEAGMIFHANNGETFDIRQVRLIANGRVEFKDGSTYNIKRIDRFEFFFALKNIRDYYRRLTEITLKEFEQTKEGD